MACVAVGLVLVVGEELSWGQRLLELSAPEFFRRYDVQREVTLHNLAGMSYVNALGYGLISIWGAVSWVLVPYLPGRVRWIARYVPGWHLSPYFLAPRCGVAPHISRAPVLEPTSWSHTPPQDRSDRA